MRLPTSPLGRPRVPHQRATWCCALLLAALPVAGHGTELSLQERGFSAEINPTVFTPQEQGVDFYAAVKRAVNRHPTVLAAQTNLVRARLFTDIERAAYYPRVTAGVGYGADSGRSPGQAVTIGVSQLLYDFGKTETATEVAEAGVLRREAELQQAVEAIALQTAEAAIRSHLLQQIQRVLTEQVHAVEQVLDLAVKRAAAGLSGEVDSMQARSRADASRAELARVSSQLNEARQRLRSLLGDTAVRDVAPLPEPGMAELLVDADASPDAAAELRIAQADLAIAHAELGRAESQWWPTLSLDASVDKDVSGRDERDPLTTGGEPRWRVNLSWTTQGNILRQQVSAASFAQQAAELQVDAARLLSNDAVLSSRALLAGDRQRLDVLRTRQASIEKVRFLYREQYKLGTRSILDLLSAEQELQQARSDWEIVRHDYWTRLVGLVAATAQSISFYGLPPDYTAKGSPE